MIQHRLDRRLVILRATRQGAFDPDQRYLENAERTRASRQLRVLLRRSVPVTMVTPRWSQARRFLDDVSTDLLLGEPSVVCRTLSLLPLQGRTPQQAWAWLVQAITEFCRLDLDGPAWQVVSRRGFRHVMSELFQRAEHGERRCLMIHGAQHMHVEALRDLLEVLEAHVNERRREPRFNLLLSGALAPDHFSFEGAAHITLPDYAPEEAMENLAEYSGVAEQGMLEPIVELVGGVPAFLDTLGAQSGDLTQLLVSQDNLWTLLGPLTTDIRSAVDMALTDDALSARLDALVTGPKPADEVDEALHISGLVRTEGGQTELRAPALAGLIDAS